ncbi:aminopeptidase N [Pleionea sp. CnH1-48]|uniref:aminopeptidase N n=1 Tax=Pleionea sp. CnH1-48 TaxID=2954494 RepID=UPI002097CEA5|nr:aminopeptidase N [Pleionea sp. CnH1-48]MCO7226953.1 aminopeptidase N [Pleionea sp. CnH1-48]
MKDASAPAAKYRKDYRPTDFLIDETHLNFKLFDDHALVESRLMLRRNPKGDAQAQSLCLDGEQLELQSIAIDGEALPETAYKTTTENLTVNVNKDQFELQLVVKIVPQKNTSLEGLYTSAGKFCTQCEAEGFRKITYYYDRPDILSRFFVTIEADKQQYPLLLSNGNPIAQKELDNGRHLAEWEDPFPKPCYLFALVAGDLDLLEDSFTTRSGREVKLQLFVDKGKLDQSEFAMASLINAMRWDEERYNLEYDLDLYMIVAVGDFNMGAMENKGLNIFNTKYVLANRHTATDMDFEHIESVIGHEYFHNWTGNRVTCRDWFQLSLKEGLTVFRDQQFTEDMRSKAVKRIDDVKVIRSHQFAEDAGPMSHPIRPESYIEMNNFYTVTVYNKGSEVIRMMHTLLGEEGFQQGMALYFKRHDGEAATCDDFVAAMADANEYDLEQFTRWYSQSGTPELSAGFDYNADKQQLNLHFKQKLQQESHEAFHIPVLVGLLDEQGNALSFSQSEEGESLQQTILHIKQMEQSVVLYNVTQSALPSLLRNFSAPVKLHAQYNTEQLAFLFAHDSDSFSCWDAGQQLIQRYVDSQGKAFDVSYIVNGFKSIIENTKLDNAFKARALTLPDLRTLFEAAESPDIDAMITTRESLKQTLSDELADHWSQVYLNNREAEYSNSQESIAKRAIKNVALGYLMQSSKADSELLKQHHAEANNMTDKLANLSVATHQELPCAEEFLSGFYEEWKHEALLMDKWLQVQSSAPTQDVYERIAQLRNDPVFDLKNPNKVRALYAGFAALNFKAFHDASGKGYELIRDTIVEVDSVNPQVAAMLSKQFSSAPRLDSERRNKVTQCLQTIVDKKSLSKDVFEIVSKTLEQLNEQ